MPSLAVSAVLLGLTAGGALASAFSISGQQFKISADSLTGTGFQQFGSVVTVSGQTQVPVAETEIGSATLTNLCQSVVTTLPVLGAFTLRITAGAGGTPVSASSLVIEANQLAGSTATFKNISIGQDASTLSEIPGAPAGAAGTFGQQADSVTISNLQQTALTTTAGTFTLPGFNLSLTSGSNGCF